jgi:hypothetical protein
VIDDHVHPFPLTFRPLEPAQISLDVTPGEAATANRSRMAPGQLYLHLLQTRLAALLGVAPEDAVAARDERAAGGWTRWVRSLFDDAEISGMIVDEAVPAGTPSRVEDLARVAARPVWQMARIDPLVDTLIGDGADAADIVAAVEGYLADAADAGCVAYKTIVAYRTGLDIDPDVDLEAAQRSLTSSLPVRRRGKALRDLVLRTVLGRAADLGKPVQFHTGFGDSEIRLAEANPLLLEELLRTPEGQAATVVLIHGSFPWHQEAAYLACTKPNVWLEFSLSNLFAPVGTADRLQAALDLTPRGKVLLGTDGHGQPETHWFAATVLRDAWARVTDRLRELGVDRRWLEETRAAIFEENAREVYALD